MEAEKILEVAANTLNDKKASEMTAIKIDRVSDLADFFLICTATSNTHVRALADEVEEKLGQLSVQPFHKEGQSSEWLLIDYGTVVIHIFTKKAREFYLLDRLWNDGEQIDLTGILDSGVEE